jgi:hypothetical protein
LDRRDGDALRHPVSDCVVSQRAARVSDQPGIRVIGRAQLSGRATRGSHASADVGPVPRRRVFAHPPRLCVSRKLPRELRIGCIPFQAHLRESLTFGARGAPLLRREAALGPPRLQRRAKSHGCIPPLGCQPGPPDPTLAPRTRQPSSLDRVRPMRRTWEDPRRTATQIRRQPARPSGMCRGRRGAARRFLIASTRVTSATAGISRPEVMREAPAVGPGPELDSTVGQRTRTPLGHDQRDG